jgi:glycosyltransferase involved in cell wall biosynthesis
MITVITPTHRRPDLLYRCIKSIQRQTLEDYEHIVVGDLCPKARQVVEFVNDPRIKYYETPPDRPRNVGGVGKNIGIEKASNNAICYCDDDNLLLPNALLHFYNNLSDLDYAVGNLISTRYMSIGNNSILSILTAPFMSVGDYSIHDYDMICYVHTKELANRVGGWSYAADIGNNEDGNLIDKFRNASQRYKKFNDTIAIYHDRMACVTSDIDYDFRVSQLKKDELFVYPEITLRVR